jgi:hypothetical protein
MTKSQRHFSALLSSTIFVILIVSCKKTIVEHPFTEINTLDCRNLLIRKVVLKNSTIEVSLENTCKTCEEGWVYLGMTMTSRQNQADTLAQTACLFCLSGPKNGETLTYTLNTSLTSLPDLKTVRFDFGYLCTDVTVLPK